MRVVHGAGVSSCRGRRVGEARVQAWVPQVGEPRFREPSVPRPFTFVPKASEMPQTTQCRNTGSPIAFPTWTAAF